MEETRNYEDHLVGFFEFYGDFDFTHNVICPYLGRAIPIRNYPSNDADLKKFDDKIKNFKQTAVNVADTLNLNFNIAFGVGKKRIEKFKQFCGHAIVLLDENL